MYVTCDIILFKLRHLFDPFEAQKAMFVHQNSH